MSRTRAADDFTVIRQRIAELRREQAGAKPMRDGGDRDGRGLGRIDEHYRDRAEGAPPPWVPTIFLR